MTDTTQNETIEADPELSLAERKAYLEQARQRYLVQALQHEINRDGLAVQPFVDTDSKAEQIEELENNIENCKAAARRMQEKIVELKGQLEARKIPFSHP